jgi:hypothetical protein
MTTRVSIGSRNALHRESQHLMMARPCNRRVEQASDADFDHGPAEPAPRPGASNARRDAIGAQAALPRHQKMPAFAGGAESNGGPPPWAGLPLCSAHVSGDRRDDPDGASPHEIRVLNVAKAHQPSNAVAQGWRKINVEGSARGTAVVVATAPTAWRRLWPRSKSCKGWPAATACGG